ncbi:tRNA uridine-5-carboxymethylaminomethyl(34) synthesis GTPase MnmE [Sandaracinobacteroides saxicola]|uniref:tRNA modification GTPase MnmE n=1 Tax=Sandaracinobacteroides saxicola TaxID=2759707 RepID=A0A7G5IH82_9SPHN|nr:tRNA uridine-5-carboxymethylaminomethyl(34) synthesis GTPase MnmE [Sandaracinobacteroides saxicola]QMW22724.1 tRNA uridine-5-carboxymethylaminomethyl(34) synthesis GTPase MnmE [Sandaracinobacteroides saxicola]
MSTIFALGSGTPPAGVALIRLSGPAAGPTLKALTNRPLPAPRHTSLRRLHDPRTGTLLDTALTLWFPAPASFTGEDCVELHLHGSPAVVAGVLDALSAMPGLHPAEAGEFTRRAFLNGRIDLTQAEALSDLIVAETAAQRDQALTNASGRLRAKAESWRHHLLTLLADAEADLDFAEEEADVAAGLATVRHRVAPLLAELDSALASADSGARVRDGLTIAVIGPPNAGKSSLVNALAARDVAIVTPHAGTTRDIIEVPLNLGGVPAIVLDTAGLRDSTDPVEAEGIARARARAASADLILLLGEESIDVPGSVLKIRNKIDLSEERPGDHGSHVALSATTGAGLDSLLDRLIAWARAQMPPGEPALVTHARHVHWLSTAREDLRAAQRQPDPVLRAESLRLAVRALGRLTGAVDAEAVLDQIFSRFCIGK